MEVVFHQFVSLGQGHGLVAAALLANAPNQALGQNGEQRIPEIEGVGAHVQQASHRFGSAVGVQRGKHQVASQRGFNGDFRCFLVANLAHHDHIRVGPQESAKGLGEGPVNLWIDLNLAQTDLGDFNRIFCGPNLPIWRVDMAQHRVQGGGLA